MDEHTLLRVSELSEETLADNGLPLEHGIYLYILDDRPLVGGIAVVGKVASEDAAFSLFDLLAEKMRARSALAA